jgi:hypothetical protein
MLAQIQHGTTFSNTRLKPDDEVKRRELRLLNALATIMVREHEIVAVVRKMGGKPGILEVIACVHLPSDTDELTPAQTDHQNDPNFKNVGTQIWRLLATPNPRKPQRTDPEPSTANANSSTADSLFPTSDVPSIVDPEDRIPEDLKDGTRPIETYIGEDL